MISAIGPADLAADPLLLAGYATYGKNCQASHDKYIETLEARKATLQKKKQAVQVVEENKAAIKKQIADGDDNAAEQLVSANATMKALQTDVAALEQEIGVIGVNIRVTRDVATHNAATVAIAEDIMRQAKKSDEEKTALPTVTVGASLGAVVSLPEAAVAGDGSSGAAALLDKDTGASPGAVVRLPEGVVASLSGPPNLNPNSTPAPAPAPPRVGTGDGKRRAAETTEERETKMSRKATVADSIEYHHGNRFLEMVNDKKREMLGHSTKVTIYQAYVLVCQEERIAPKFMQDI